MSTPKAKTPTPAQATQEKPKKPARKRDRSKKPDKMVGLKERLPAAPDINPGQVVQLRRLLGDANPRAAAAVRYLNAEISEEEFMELLKDPALRRTSGVQSVARDHALKFLTGTMTEHEFICSILNMRPRSDVQGGPPDLPSFASMKLGESLHMMPDGTASGCFSERIQNRERLVSAPDNSPTIRDCDRYDVSFKAGETFPRFSKTAPGQFVVDGPSTPKASITESQAAQDATIARTEDLVQTLEARLEGVLRAASPQLASPPIGNPLPSSASPVADHIRSTRFRVIQLNDRIISILDRLDI